MICTEVLVPVQGHVPTKVCRSTQVEPMFLTTDPVAFKTRRETEPRRVLKESQTMVRFASDDHSYDNSYDASYIFDHDMDFGSVVTSRTRSLISITSFTSKDPLSATTQAESADGEYFEVGIDAFNEAFEAREVIQRASAFDVDRKRRRLGYCCLLIATTSVLCGLALLIFYKVEGSGKVRIGTADQAAISQGFKEKELTEAEQYILDILDNHTSKEILLNSSTYQGQVFADLVAKEEESKESTPPFQVVQKYALLALYRSASGEGWGVKFGWADLWENACKWYGVERCAELSTGDVAVSKLNLGMCLCDSLWTGLLFSNESLR